MCAESTIRIPLKDRMPAIKEKLLEIQESLKDLTWEERNDYHTFLYALNLAIKYSDGEVGR